MFETVTAPTFVVDAEKARRNIERVAAKASRSGSTLRPHFKTHQSFEVGRMFRDRGVRAITVSSVAMARRFAEGGWDDITIAFPVNVRELAAIDELAGRVGLGLLVDCEEAIERLSSGLKNAVGLWIKIDLGTRRCGVPVSDRETVLRLLRFAAKSRNLRIAGILTHDSRTYGAVGREAVDQLYRQGCDALTALRDDLAAEGFPGLLVSYGDTPTASLVDDFSGIDELRPGNFVYYDLQQYLIGACGAEDIAAAVACPVVGIYPSRGEAVLYGGAVHLAKQDQVILDGRRSFGALFKPGQDGAPWGGFVEGAYIRSVSQEHGVAVLPPAELARLRLGDLVFVCPVHSCLAQDLLKGNTLIFERERRH